MKAEVEKGCSVLTKKGFAQEGAILQEKDFSSPEVFKNLCENSGKVKVLKEPEPEKAVEPVSAELKPDEPESSKDPEPEKETESAKKKSGRPKAGANRKK